LTNRFFVDSLISNRLLSVAGRGPWGNLYEFSSSGQVLVATGIGSVSDQGIDNYGRARKNAEFVSIELDRIEGKIQTLAEMAVNRQDPDFLSSQVDSAADSMRQTEKAVSELQHLTGLADQLEEPPPILETDLRQVLRHDA
jgi:hypothetical protein